MFFEFSKINPFSSYFLKNDAVEHQIIEHLIIFVSFLSFFVYISKKSEGLRKWWTLRGGASYQAHALHVLEIDVTSKRECNIEEELQFWIIDLYLYLVNVITVSCTYLIFYTILSSVIVRVVYVIIRFIWFIANSENNEVCVVSSIDRAQSLCREVLML